MSQYKEYSKPTVNSALCTYSSLGGTYGPNSSSAVASSGTYVVPKLCPGSSQGLSYPPRYDTLSHGTGAGCGGYFHLNSAYPAATCTSCSAEYVQRPCTGNIHSACAPPAPPTKEGYRRR